MAWVINGSNRYLQPLPLRGAFSDPKRDGRTYRRIGQRALKHIPRLEGTCHAVCRVRQQPELRCNSIRGIAIKRRLRSRSCCGAQRLGQVHDGFALSCPRQSNHGLSRADNLSGLGERLHHHAVGIRKQHRITRSITGNVSLRFSGAKLRLCGIRCGFDLVVGRCRNSACGNQTAVSRLVICCLLGSGPSGNDRLLLCSRLQP
ncbi:hypothetical protein AN403_5686 [Pseudomonas fluorescens]|uniref:Uncharacterized protein n=1 Tax=Pseudomonas fluorescens TaxID=294 RepID=A0A0P8XMC7_PSEFL|nr:hypothetical protein AN403_5686 [Pseudomonas fluorescens]